MFDPNHILPVHLQGHETNQKLLGSANGIDHLLVCLAGFKNKDPADAEEQEFVENLFDTLCSCLLSPANRWELLLILTCTVQHIKQD